jgi:hypothetical protein
MLHHTKDWPVLPPSGPPLNKQGTSTASEHRTPPLAAALSPVAQTSNRSNSGGVTKLTGFTAINLWYECHPQRSAPPAFTRSPQAVRNIRDDSKAILRCAQVDP